MSFENDLDLTKDFNDLIGGKKKSKSTDFDFSRENAAKLDLGFDDTVKNDPIEAGHKRIVKPDGRRKRIRPLKKGAKFVSEGNF